MKVSSPSKEKFLRVVKENENKFLASFRELQTPASRNSIDSVLARLTTAGFATAPSDTSNVTARLPGSSASFDFRIDLGAGEGQKRGSVFSIAVAESAAKLISLFDQIPKCGIGIILKDTHPKDKTGAPGEPFFLWDLNPTMMTGSVGFSRSDLNARHVDIKIVLTSADHQQLFDSLGRILSGLPRLLLRKFNTLTPGRFIFSDLSEFPSDVLRGFTLSGRCLAFDNATLERLKTLVEQSCTMLAGGHNVDCRIESVAPVIQQKMHNSGIRHLEDAARDLFEPHEVLTPEYPSLHAMTPGAAVISVGLASRSAEQDLQGNLESSLLSAISLLAFACLS